VKFFTRLNEHGYYHYNGRWAMAALLFLVMGNTIQLRVVAKHKKTN
jgi:hypothetical protein